MLATNILISDKCVIKHNGEKISRTYNILNSDSKPYYFLTEYLDKSSIYFNKIHGFSLKGTIVKDLNEFKKGITDRIRFRTLIPQYENQKSYIINLKTIKLDDDIKYSNIIEYDGKKNNFNFMIVSMILSLCKYKLLLKIESFTITQTNVYFNIRLVRINPESLDPIPDDKKIYIFKQLNLKLFNNINDYEKINNSVVVSNKRYTKKQVSNELINALRKKKH